MVYRERLVRNNNLADFNLHPLRLEVIDLRGYPEPDPFEAVLSANRNITNLNYIGVEYGEYEWHCQYKESGLNVCHYTWEGTALREILYRFNCTDQERFPLPNMEAYRIGNAGCVIQKNQALYCLIGEKAQEAAIELFGN